MTVSRGLNVINKGQMCPNHSDRPAHTRGLCKSCYNKRLLKSNTVYAQKQRQNHAEWVKKNLAKSKEYHRQYNQKIAPEKKRDSQLKRNYGISLLEYQKLFKKQNGKCAICSKRSDKTLHVDHDHKTGRIRGLLCFRCNYGLGYFKDNLKQFKQIVKYLEGQDG
jgi:hypothetical protein